MKITQEVRDYAQSHGIAEDHAIETGIAHMLLREFVDPRALDGKDAPRSRLGRDVRDGTYGPGEERPEGALGEIQAHRGAHEEEPEKNEDDDKFSIFKVRFFDF
jgi:hypothetical protein